MHRMGNINKRLKTRQLLLFSAIHIKSDRGIPEQVQRSNINIDNILQQCRTIIARRLRASIVPQKR